MDSLGDVTNTDSADQLEFMNSMFAATIPSAHGLGVRVVEVRRGFAATTAPIAGNGNHFGVMYAGELVETGQALGGGPGGFRGRDGKEGAGIGRRADPRR